MVQMIGGGIKHRHIVQKQPIKQKLMLTNHPNPPMNNLVILSPDHLNKKPYNDLVFHNKPIYDILWRDVNANQRQQIEKYRPNKMVVVEYEGKKKMIKWAEKH